MADDPYTPPVKGPDGMMYRRPWELVSETLMQYRTELVNDPMPWTPPVPSQEHDPLAGAYPPPMETTRVPNYRSLNAAFNSGPRAGQGDIQPSASEYYMVPPRYGWRTDELSLVDIMDGVMSKLEDPANPANAGYLDDWSGQNGSYGGSGQMEHNSMEIPQGL